MKTMNLDTPDAIREFVNGACAHEARQLVEEVGIFNIDSDEFDQAIETLYKQLGSDDGTQEVINALCSSGGSVSGPDAIGLGRKLDAAHTDSLIRRADAAYLLGLAVGQRIK